MQQCNTEEIAMPDPAPRILFASPNESLIQAFYQAIPKDEHNILAINVLDQPVTTVVEYARASSIEVIISRGGTAEFLRKGQRSDPDAIPIVQIQVTAFDIIDAVCEAQKVSRNMAFIAYPNMLEGAKKIMDLFDLDQRFVARSSPWDCLEAIFTALEHKAEVIVGDARVVKMCQENSIPAVFLNASQESLRQACDGALRIIEARDDSRRETRRIAAILDQLDQGLIALDGDGHVLYSNAPADRLAGVGKKQLLGLGMQQIPFFQRHFTSSFFLNGTGKTVFACGDNKRECVARWQRIEPEIFGINGLISLDVGREVSAGPRRNAGTGDTAPAFALRISWAPALHCKRPRPKPASTPRPTPPYFCMARPAWARSCLPMPSTMPAPAGTSLSWPSTWRLCRSR